jgi:hypothetical protein
VVNRGEKTAITASFNSLNFGQRNFKFLFLIDYFIFFYFSSSYLSTTLFSHNFTPEACAPFAMAWAAVGEVININTAQIIAFAASGPEALEAVVNIGEAHQTYTAEYIKQNPDCYQYVSYNITHRNFCPPKTLPALWFQ